VIHAKRKPTRFCRSSREKKKLAIEGRWRKRKVFVYAAWRTTLRLVCLSMSQREEEEKEAHTSNTQAAKREQSAVNHENFYCSRKNLKENAQSEIEMRKQPRAVEQLTVFPLAGCSSNKVYA
jgi:hypothetical protein